MLRKSKQGKYEEFNSIVFKTKNDKAKLIKESKMKNKQTSKLKNGINFMG